MKRKLLALALSTASSAVFADVSLYGRVAVGVENDQFQNTTIPGTSNIQDYGSYFGIRGVDPVYGDTSAIWQVEQLLDVTTMQPYYFNSAGGLTPPRSGVPGTCTAKSNGTCTGSPGRVTTILNTLASSESYLGLQGLWGRMKIGNLSNYMRSDMGTVDIYNYANGVNGFALFSRTSRILPTSIRYDSPSWSGFSFSGMYSFNTNGQPGVSGIGATNDFGVGLDGYYSGGIYSAGMGWSGSNFTVNLGTTVWQNVGAYTNGMGGMNTPTNISNAVQYYNAYANRLELSYDNPDGLIVGLGVQTTNGMGWNFWVNSGGSFNNFVVNPGYFNQGLTTNQYQTQELGASLGYHFGPWTPKIGYMFGNNMMYNGNLGTVLLGTADQIPNSGYQQAVAELDWNINPRTIVFVNYGQAWYGSTLQNTSWCGTNCGNPANNYTGTVNGNNQAFFDQSTVGIGLSHTF